MPNVFMRCAWRNLLMINYVIDPAKLQPFVPRGTEIETFNGQALISLVGFEFLNTRAWGIPLLFHQHFAEFNLRFYVRREVDGIQRGGVVFVREIVPRWAFMIAFGARTLYRERYSAMPMKTEFNVPGKIGLKWKHTGAWDEVQAETIGDKFMPKAGEAGNYITEHYWGYATQRDGGTLEYQVEHPPWHVWNCRNVSVQIRAEKLYGSAFVDALSATPHSAFIADGSEVAIRKGTRIASAKEPS